MSLLSRCIWSLIVTILSAQTVLAERAIPSWAGIKPAKPYDFFLISDFNNDVRWRILSDHAMQGRTVLADMKPSLPDPKSVTGMETNAMYRQDADYAIQSASNFLRADLADQEKSLVASLFISHPGHESMLLGPIDPVFLPGHCKAISVWIKGVGKKHTLSAVFLLPDGKNYELEMGKLDFKGWGRLESKIPVHLQSRDPNNLKRYSMKFVGFKLTTWFREEPGLTQLTLNLPIVLADRSEERNPFELYQSIWD